MNKAKWVGALAGGVLVSLLLWFGAGEDLDEVAIAARLQEMTTAVEQGDREAFWSHLAPDYRPVGRGISQYTPEMIVDRIFQIPARMENLRIDLIKVKIDIEEDRRSAKVQFQVSLEGEGMPWSVSRDQLERNRVQLKMRRYGTDWRVLESALAWSVMPF